VYATNKAQEMTIPGGLSEKHWQILWHLQEEFGRAGVVPTVIECCKAIGIELDELEIPFRNALLVVAPLDSHVDRPGQVG